MQTPMETAREHLENGLRQCVRDKFLIENGHRSGTVMNILHKAIYDAYAALLDGHDLSGSIHLRGEHEGRIVLPYEDGVKNIDLGLKLLGTNTYLDAIFVKSPINNYSQNRRNYEESMAGTFFKCRTAHSHLRVVFLDFLPLEDIYFKKSGVCTGWSTLRTPNLPAMDESHPACYASGRYSFHPRLKEAATKNQFVSIWKQLELEGATPIEGVDVQGILNTLMELVDDLELATQEAKNAESPKTPPLVQGLEMFEKSSLDGGNDIKMLGKSLGLIRAALGGYGARQRRYLYRKCGQRWENSRADGLHAWSLLDHELTHF